MDIRLLTDTVVRQTTVLLAQIATAAGVRAPLAHVASQVFLDLARELEAQGVRRKVVADMFGLALRSYQIKMRRLLAHSHVPRSTWQSVFALLEQQSATRNELARRFPTVAPRDLGAVLHDLVDSGLVYCSGGGNSAVYGLTSEADRMRLEVEDDVHSLSNRLWVLLSTMGDQTAHQLRQQLHHDRDHLEQALDELVNMGRVARREQAGDVVFEALSFHIPVGSEQGWEAAVCDHFGAVATALGSKLVSPRSREDDTIGGATLRFAIHPEHPLRGEVLGLLQRVRAEVGELWQRVAEHNRQHPPPEEKEKVTFYYGQSVTATSDTGSDTMLDETKPIPPSGDLA